MQDEDLLYHYTSAEGLIGLVGTHRTPAAMWLTQVQYMNDAVELSHAYELARQDLMTGREEWPGCRRAMAGLWGVPHEGDRLETAIMEQILHRYCAFSISEEPDLLSQWRGYVPNGGYSIGFRSENLKSLASHNGFAMQPCIYDDAIKHSEIAEAFRRIEAGINCGEIEIDPLHINSIPETERPLTTARLRIQQWLMARAPFYKHASFSEEREWRIAGPVGATDPRARWRARGNQVVPYCELEIGIGATNPVLAKTVTIGPGLDFELGEHAIRFMNFSRFNELSVHRSNSTLRR